MTSYLTSINFFSLSRTVFGIFDFKIDVALLNKFKNINNLETEINRDLETLNEWEDKWNMDLNPAKTEMVIFSNKKIKSEPNIKLKGEQIERFVI